jgi:RNA polymerase sigma-70 factor (ECF subfamily)
MTAAAESTFDEHTLVADAIRNERRAQDVLYDRYAAGIYRLAHRMCNDPDLASDFTQETFIRAFDALPGFRHESTFGTWIHRIALSVILSGLRLRKRRESRRVPLETIDSIGVHDVHSDQRLRERLHAAIDSLPDGYRTVFVLYAIEGFTHPQIAAMLGVSVSTSQGQLFRARARLREMLANIAGEVEC